jgi:hypothetical protein
MTLLMLDSVDPRVFAGLKFDALAGYVAGSWPDYSTEVALYPELAKAGRILSITPSAVDDAECLDCENGDAVPGQCGPWVARQRARGVWRPVVYSSASEWPSVQQSIDAAGLQTGEYRKWVADWTFTPEILAGFDAQQWTDHYESRNIDGSQTLDTFFQTAPQPPHKNSPHYDWFPTGPFGSRWGPLNERGIVEAYDAHRVAPAKHKEALTLERVALRFLAQRVAFEAIHAHPLPAPSPAWGSSKPSWSVDHRGYRYQQLIHRSQGQRFV